MATLNDPARGGHNTCNVMDQVFRRQFRQFRKPVISLDRQILRQLILSRTFKECGNNEAAAETVSGSGKDSVFFSDGKLLLKNGTRYDCYSTKIPSKRKLYSLHARPKWEDREIWVSQGCKPQLIALKKNNYLIFRFIDSLGQAL